MMGYLIFSSLVIAVLVIFLLILFGIRVQRNNIWLICFLFVLGYSAWIGYLMDTGSIFGLPHLIRTGTICGYLIVPMLYVYVRSTCYPGFVWRWWYVFLFAPSFFFIIDLIPFWISPAAEKVSMFRQSMQTLKSLHAFSEGWLSPKGFHFVFRLLWSICWFSLIIRDLVRNRQLLTASTTHKNQLVYRFIMGLTLLCLPFLLAHLIFNLFFANSYTLSNFTFLLALPLIMSGFYLMLFPSVVYGLQPPVPADTLKIIPALPAKENINPEPLLSTPAGSNEDMKQVYDLYAHHLNQFMEKERPYLQQGLTINNLGEKSGIPTYILTMLINRHFGQTFKTWINSYRIEAFKRLMEQPNAHSFTMESLGKASGFGSRVTLINSFKKATGLTPGQYFKDKGTGVWSEFE